MGWFLSGLVIAAAIILLAIFWYGLGRSGRLHRFVQRRGGEFSAFDEFDLQATVHTVHANDDVDAYVGHSARFEPDGLASPTYLYELHRQSEGRASSTAALTTLDDPPDDLPRILRARTPSPDTDATTFADRFAVVDGEPDDVPADLADLLDERADALDWLPELYVVDNSLAVASRERVLADADEWRELLKLLEAAQKALNKRSPEEPALAESS